jgi:hypothetical protein
MAICEIKKFKQETNGDLPMLSSLRVEYPKTNNDRDIILTKTLNKEDNKVFVKCVSKNVLVGNYGGSIKEEDTANVYASYITLWKKDGVEYPANVILDIYPKYRLVETALTNLDELDSDMTELKTANCYFGFGDISCFARCKNLENITINTKVGDEGIYGNIISLAPLVKLATFDIKGNGAIYGDIAVLADKMYENGRTSGILEMKGSSKLVFLKDKESGTTYRFGNDANIITVTFSDSGWTYQIS